MPARSLMPKGKIPSCGGKNSSSLHPVHQVPYIFYSYRAQEKSCCAGQTCLRDFRLPVEFTAMPMFEDNFDHYVYLVLGEWTIRVRRTSGFPPILVCCKKCTPHALAARGGALWQDNLAPSTAASSAKDLDGQRIGATNEAGKFNCIASSRTRRQG